MSGSISMMNIISSCLYFFNTFIPAEATFNYLQRKANPLLDQSDLSPEVGKSIRAVCLISGVALSLTLVLKGTYWLFFKSNAKKLDDSEEQGMPRSISRFFSKNKDVQNAVENYEDKVELEKPSQSLMETIPFERTSLLKNVQTSECEVEVSYKFVKGKQLAEAIKQVCNPQVIFWYIGVYGLREQGVKYYRKELTKILQASTATCQLYDLTAWAPFNPKNRDSTLQDFNKNADLINQFAIPRINCLKSCDFFNWLMKVEEGNKMEKLKKIFQRPFIYQQSQSYSQTARTMREIFKNSCPVIEELYQLDASKSYSALQYVEGIYLVQSLVKKSLLQEPESKEINLVFALPNNEYLYYQDEANSLAQDVKAILQEECSELLADKKVNVMFYIFEFGKGGFNRPYNAGPKNIEQLQDPSEIVNLSQLKNNKEG